MIVVDTSVWIHHLRTPDPLLRRRLEARAVLVHPVVIGEVALGRIGDRASVLRLLQAMPQTVIASDAEVLGLIEQRSLEGSGVGYADVQLLAATLLTPGARLWTHDRRLHAVATRLGVEAPAV